MVITIGRFCTPVVRAYIRRAKACPQSILSEVSNVSLHLVTTDKGDYLEGSPGVRLLNTADSVSDLISACFEHGVHLILLHAENLTERFFDLSSGEAGAILQKLRNYHVKLGVLLPEGGSPQSRMFREMVAEELRGNDFSLFEDRAAALAWLLHQQDSAGVDAS
jgi:hypothetical protein